MDALTEVLKSVKLHSTVHCRSELSAPWGIQIDAMKDASFHVVMRGSCWLEIAGADAPLPLVGGDLVVLPTGVAHTLRDRLDSPVVRLENLLANRPCKGQLTLHHGGGGVSTVVLCGKASFEQREMNPLLSALPPLVLIQGEAGRSVEWLDSTLQFIACEAGSNRPGAEMMITYLSNIVFIQAVRAYLASLKQQEGGWLRALTDPQMSVALALIHRHPETSWTVAALAKQLNMSRSAFAARFKELIGETPLQYITRWRIHCAVDLLRLDTTLADIAERVGYQSETAFSKVFKRQLGQSPREYRKQQSAS